MYHITFSSLSRLFHIPVRRRFRSLHVKVLVHIVPYEVLLLHEVLPRDDILHVEFFGERMKPVVLLAFADDVAKEFLRGPFLEFEKRAQEIVKSFLLDEASDGHKTDGPLPRCLAPLERVRRHIDGDRKRKDLLGWKSERNNASAHVLRHREHKRRLFDEACVIPCTLLLHDLAHVVAIERDHHLLCES